MLVIDYYILIADLHPISSCNLIYKSFLRYSGVEVGIMQLIDMGAWIIKI